MLRAVTTVTVLLRTNWMATPGLPTAIPSVHAGVPTLVGV
jgi:hypothetical protein